MFDFIWFIRNWQWIVNTSLIILTLVVSLLSYHGRRKTVVRELLNELGDNLVTGSIKIRPTLFSYKFNKLILEFKYYQGETVGATADKHNPGQLRGWKPIPPDIRFEKSDVKTLDYVSEVSEEETGLHVKCKTTDPVECRKVADQVIRIIYASYH